MLVKTIDGVEYEWEISEKIAKGNKRKTSKGHKLAKRLIGELYPCCRFYEEVPVTVKFKHGKEVGLFLDFFIPSLSLAVEIQGEQHYVFNRFFHKTKFDFLKAQQRDKDKAYWCQINGIKLITLSYRKHEEEWKTQLMMN